MTDDRETCLMTHLPHQLVNNKKRDEKKGKNQEGNLKRKSIQSKQNISYPI